MYRRAREKVETVDSKHQSGKLKYYFCYNMLDAIVSTGKKRKRCGICAGCTADDCRICMMCLDKPKYGGPGKKKKCCTKRVCINMIGSSKEKTLDVNKTISNLHSYTEKLGMFVRKFI